MILSDEEILRFLKEDVPSFDLTTQLMGIGEKNGVMSIKAREEGVLCGTEEVARLCELIGLHVNSKLASGTKIKKDDVVISMEGRADLLHKAWKVSANILENMSGIATRTRKMVDNAGGASVVSTRKIMPGTRNIATKAVIAGGGLPHRLGLSETVLVFDKHTAFLQEDEFIPLLAKMKKESLEKKINVEVENEKQALELALHVDVLQCDKIPLQELKSMIPKVKNINPNIVILAAGGINPKNVREFSGIGIDVMVSSAMYWGKPLDFGVTMTPKQS